MIREGKSLRRCRFSRVLQERRETIKQTLREQHSERKKKKKYKDPEESRSRASNGVIGRKEDQRSDILIM